MKKTKEYNIISFGSTHMAIKSEKLLLEKNIDIKIIPVPREITASCGLSLRINLDIYEMAKKILEENNIEFSGCYKVKQTGLKKEIIDINS